MRRLSIAGLLILGLLMSRSIGAQTPDLIVPGAGAIGTWQTFFQFANGADATVTVRLAVAGVVVPSGNSCPPSACVGALDLTLAPNGFSYAVVGDAIIGAPAGPTTFFVTLLTGPAVPTVSARMFNSALTSQSFEIPVIRTDALISRNPSVLVFPDGIVSGFGGRSNLVVSAYGGDVTVEVEVFTALGFSFGRRTLTIASNSTLALYRVFESFLTVVGLPEIRLPVRVTKVSGSGLIWGYLAAVDDNGGVTAAAGANW